MTRRYGKETGGWNFEVDTEYEGVCNSFMKAHQSTPTAERAFGNGQVRAPCLRIRKLLSLALMVPAGWGHEYSGHMAWGEIMHTHRKGFSFSL